MKRILALCACLSASTILSTQASNDHIAKVAFDGVEYIPNNGRYKIDGFDIAVEVVQRDEVSAELAFSALPARDKPVKVAYKAALIAQELKFTPQGERQIYKPATMTIEEYREYLNTQNIPGFRSFIWNQDGSQKVMGERGLVVTIELRKPLRFLRQTVKHNIRKHVSKVFLEFGLDGDDVTSKFLVHSFQHKPMPTKVPQVWWLNGQKQFHTLTSVVFDTLPESVRNSWAGAGAFTPQEPYAELWPDAADRGALLQNADQVEVEAGGIYFTMEEGNPLESKYVYVVGASGSLPQSSARLYRMTTLRALQPKLFRAINAKGQGFQFEDLAQTGPELHILQHTPYPLSLDPNAIVTPLFEQGYYRLSSSSRDGAYINQTFAKFPTAPGVVEYRSRTKSAFSETDLTSTLNSTTLVMSSLTKCLLNLNMAYQMVLRPRVVIRSSSLPTGRDRRWVSDMAVPLIEASLQSEENLTDPAVQQLVLTNPTLFEFLHPQIASFAQLNLEADSLHFNEEPVTNPVLEWLWKAHFKTEQVKEIDAESVHISGLGSDNWALRKLSELRGMQPATLGVTFEQLTPQDVKNLMLVVKENPNLTELHLHGPISQVGGEFFKLVADHPKLARFFFLPDYSSDNYKGLSDEQIQRIFLRERHSTLFEVDLSKEAFQKVSGKTLNDFLKNNAAQIKDFIWSDRSQIWSNWTGEIIGAIKQMSALQKFDARYAGIGDGKLPSLANALSPKATLQEVGMYLHRWNDGVREALAAIPNTTKLMLRCCDYPNWHKGELEKLVANRGDAKPTVIAE